MKKHPRRPRQAVRPRRLPDKDITLLDRSTCAWQDPGGTWHGTKKTDDVSMRADAPDGFHVQAVLQPDAPYLWIGIAAPDTQAPRLCYGIVGGKALRDLAREILRYVPTIGGAR